jgi:Family of unknown function (DUF6054)
VMKYIEIKVTIEPSTVAKILKSDSEINSDLVYEDGKTIQDTKFEIIILVFEKYFLRINSTASLTVTIDNLTGETIVKCISSGNSEGLLNLSMGADKKFIQPIKKRLDPYIEEILLET